MVESNLTSVCLCRETEEELLATGDQAAVQDVATGHPGFLAELLAVLKNPIYLCVVFGYAGFTAVVSGPCPACAHAPCRTRH